MKEQIEKLKRIYKHYGEIHQLEKLKEECKEAIEAIDIYLDNRNCQTKELLLGEIADVNVLIEQFKTSEINNQIINSIMIEKIERQLKRMENENE